MLRFLLGFLVYLPAALAVNWIAPELVGWHPSEIACVWVIAVGIDDFLSDVLKAARR